MMIRTAAERSVVTAGGPVAGSREAKAALFDVLADVAGALASGRRLEIVDLLAQGERSVEETASETAQSLANASHHLRTLARAGLLRSRRQGTRVYYRLAGPAVEALWEVLRDTAEAVRDDLARVAAGYLGPESEVDVVDRDELLDLLRRGGVVVWDVRPGPEYRAGHVPGARSVPLEDLDAALAALPDGVEVVAYCRGRHCVFAPVAVRALAGAGVPASRLTAGFPEWRRAGLPVAMGGEPGRLARSGRARGAGRRPVRTT
jgi:rhodanese-related sulfurtransferase/DNA-binding transcriptional ArsR family regulator